MVTKTVYYFVDAINKHNVEMIRVMIAVCHTFIDAHGKLVVRKDKMKAGWREYFGSH